MAAAAARAWRRHRRINTALAADSEDRQPLLEVAAAAVWTHQLGRFPDEQLELPMTGSAFVLEQRHG
jgi:hypothetical protein